MAMLTLNGLVQNVFNVAESTDRKTGEVRPSHDKVQILAENIMENGEKRLDMVTLKVPNGEPYRKALGRSVFVPVGAFVAEGKIAYYVLKNETPKLLPA